MATFNSKEEHGYKKFNQKLKSQDFKNVILLYGEEDYLIDWAVDCLVKRYVNTAVLAMDYMKYDDDEINVGAIVEACNTCSLFSEKKVVWAKDFRPLHANSVKGFSEKDRELILQYASEPSETTILIISANQMDEKNQLVSRLKPHCDVFNFCKLDYAQLAAFIEKRFNLAHYSISKELIRFLIDETGYFNKETEYRILNLESDIKKIISHCDGDVVREENITASIRGDMDTYVFNFLDALSNGKKDRAFSILNNMLGSGAEIYPILGLLVNHFELMLDVKELKENGKDLTAIAKILRASEYRIKKSTALIDKFSIKDLRSLLVYLYEIDRNIKSGNIEGRLALELFVGRI